MLVISNHIKFHLLALKVQCISPFHPNGTQSFGTNSDFIIYIILKHYLQMTHRSVLCLGALLCTIMPRTLCAVMHGIIYSLPIARWRTLWLAHFDTLPYPPTVSYWVLTTLVPSPFSSVTHWPNSLHSAYWNDPFLPSRTLQFCVHISSPKRWTPKVLRKIPHSSMWC